MPIPQSFRDRLRQKKVVPFVGAGFSMGVTTATGDALFPSWPGLLAAAAERLRAEHKSDDAKLVEALLSKNDLYEAAHRARQGLGQAHWYDFLKSVFDRTFDEAHPDSLHMNRLVWTLGSNLAITTNYDRALQWSCPDRSDFRVWDIEAKVEQVNALREGDAKRPTVWHLHGQIDNAAHMILTPDGYKKLYGNETTKAVYASALESLKAVLKSHSLLFMGFSLKDINFIKELIEINETYDGAASQHYILLPRSECDRADVLLMGVEKVAYNDLADLRDILTEMSVEALQSSGSYIRAQRYLVDRREGLHLFGGRGDAFFQLYDEAIVGLEKELDIFSLKLGRFRQKHGVHLLNLAKRLKIRIAILDPAFPLPKSSYSIASIRDDEERAQNGAIMRDVAEWCDLYDLYQKERQTGEADILPGSGLSIHLYNALPTVNLFRADTSLFVGPYLLNVEDRNTPTFLIRGDTQENTIGRHLFTAYQSHFEAIWERPGTRHITTVGATERAAWKKGEYAEIVQ